MIPLHDAILFECPSERLSEVAELTGRALAEAVTAAFPLLRPRFKANLSDPTCWNKDGRSDSWQWCRDPLTVWH